MAARYGAPYIVIHRAALHSIIHAHTLKEGTEIKLDSRVVHYDVNKSVIDLITGKDWKGILLLPLMVLTLLYQRPYLADLENGLIHLRDNSF